MDISSEEALIKKKLLYAGKQYKPLRDGCKVHFHFKTTRLEPTSHLVDDSRVIGKKEPMVLVLGKKFKLEVWETILKMMAIGEIAEFTVDKSLVVQYPFISKTLRDLEKDASERRSHFCGVTLQNEGIGYKDLNDLIARPSDLMFTIECLKVEFPEDYEKETWQMTDQEKLENVPVLQELGNTLFNKKDHTQAANNYSEAIALLEQLSLKEKPHDEEWKKLEDMKIPLLLNFSQCKLIEGDYYAVIEHCTTVLKADPDNVKALYKRAKANMAAWSPDAAVSDFTRLKSLDPSLVTVINKELKTIQEMRKAKDMEDKEKLKGLFG